MNDLNILHAQNADLKSRVSDSGLACDSPVSGPDRKDINAFELAMRGGARDFPQSLLSGEYPENMLENEKNFFSALHQNTDHGGERNQGKIDSYRVSSGEEDKKVSDSFGKNDTLTPENSHSQLASLFSMASTFNDVEAPARVDAPHVILSEDDLNMLVERILVSAANDGTQEVRLILNERVLAGTEIILSRDLSGQLVVALHCSDASTFQTLVASQLDLKQMLESRESSSVQVSVDIHQDGNDAERRSQGYFAYEPDQLRKRDSA